MENIFTKLAELANKLDQHDLYIYADKIDLILKSAGDLDEKFEDTNLTLGQANDIISRYSGDDVEVKIYGQPPNEKVILKFPDGGPDAMLTGNEWDRIQVILGIM